MCKALRGFLAVLFGVSLCLASAVVVFGGGSPAQTVNLPSSGFESADDGDEEEPDIQDRVARISFIRGESRIRRLGADEWEKTTLNLPIVEGDEIVTDGDARIEIQFDKNQHLRLAENSYLKIANLKDTGIAVSLSLGTLSLRITAFDKDKAFFEIDAPKTTLSIERAGAYRVDAGKQGDSEIRVTATEGGEARIYSDNAGFALKNGRSTRIFIDGPMAGESETSDASRLDDDFGQWAAEREAIIAKRLKDAHYDKFYDNDIYGADELNGNGEWIHTVDYGYVWRPYKSSISGYADWSPYRYGHWRWMPPYGWIWVNDEPWGWATYHHGRWFYYGGHWNWSPYGYYRHRRSWWWGAHVVINIFNNNICWYPSPYHRRRHNYNANYTRKKGFRHGRNTPIVPVGPTGKIGTRKNPPVDDVPVKGVVAVNPNDFGTRMREIKSVSGPIAKEILSTPEDDGSGVVLPAIERKRRNPDGGIVAEKPRDEIVVTKTRVGAAPRKSGTPMDTELRTTRILGGRPPLVSDPNPKGMEVQPRKTGAVDRPPPIKQPNPEILLTTPKEREKPVMPDEVDTPPRRPQVVTPKEPPPPPRYERPAEPEKRRDSPPPPRYERPAEPEKRRDSPPPQKETQRERPKSDSPPAKSEPKTESKPAPAPPARKDKPDSRR